MVGYYILRDSNLDRHDQALIVLLADFKVSLLDDVPKVETSFLSYFLSISPLDGKL